MADPTTKTKLGLIQERFAALIQRPNSLVVAYDNLGPTTPTDPPIPRDEPKPGDVAVWCEFKIEPGIATTRETGRFGRYNNPGTIVVTIYSGLGKGSAASLDLAQKIVSAYRGVKADGVSYMNVSPLDGRRDEDGGWWQTPVRIDYRYDD